MILILVSVPCGLMCETLEGGQAANDGLGELSVFSDPGGSGRRLTRKKSGGTSPVVSMIRIVGSS